MITVNSSMIFIIKFNMYLLLIYLRLKLAIEVTGWNVFRRFVLIWAQYFSNGRSSGQFGGYLLLCMYHIDRIYVVPFHCAR